MRAFAKNSRCSQNATTLNDERFNKLPLLFSNCVKVSLGKVYQKNITRKIFNCHTKPSRPIGYNHLLIAVLYLLQENSEMNPTHLKNGLRYKKIIYWSFFPCKGGFDINEVISLSSAKVARRTDFVVIRRWFGCLISKNMEQKSKWILSNVCD
jgi:hypothetical protein